MKFITQATLVLATTGALVAGNSHIHHHRHVDKRVAAPDTTQTVVVPGPTLVVYDFGGKLISEAEVCKGITDGSMTWAPGTEDLPNCGASVDATPTPQVAGPTPATPTGNDFHQQSSSSAAPTSAAASPPVSASSSSYDVQIGSNPNVGLDFPDGQLSCSTFPSAYGAIPVNWMGLNGWTGIQYATIAGQYVANINTALTGGSGCAALSDGSTTFCSYACPPGYQKSQWPSQQGPPSASVSVGGIMCGQDGKLHLTNPGYSKKLCVPGSGLVSVENQLGSTAAICRTDYPGTEDESVPLNTHPGTTNALTCPYAATYYQHLYKSTSAEYYVNPSGTAVDKACTWSTDGSNVGNWAPVVFGVGTDTSSNTWLSIMTTRQNNPTSYKELDYWVQLEGDFGASNTCYYVSYKQVGYYCTRGSASTWTTSNAAANCVTYDALTQPVPGCTVQLMSGTAKYVLTSPAMS